MNEISDIESTASNVRTSDIESYPVERLEPTMKVQVYMQAYKNKIYTKREKRNQQSYFGMKQTKTLHKKSKSTTWSHRQIRR